jgi:hypothetical protein
LQHEAARIGRAIATGIDAASWWEHRWRDSRENAGTKKAIAVDRSPAERGGGIGATMVKKCFGHSVLLDDISVVVP